MLNFILSRESYNAVLRLQGFYWTMPFVTTPISELMITDALHQSAMDILFGEASCQ